jgi:hypothetical protein
MESKLYKGPYCKSRILSDDKEREESKESEFA